MPKAKPYKDPLHIDRKERARLISLIRDMAHVHKIEHVFTQRVSQAIGTAISSEYTLDFLANTSHSIDDLCARMLNDIFINDDEFLTLWCWVDSELWIARRMLPDPKLPKSPVGRLHDHKNLTREQLEAWALHHHISSWLDEPFYNFLEDSYYLDSFLRHTALGPILNVTTGYMLAADSPRTFKHHILDNFIQSVRDDLDELVVASGDYRPALLKQLDAPSPALAPQLQTLRDALVAQTRQMLHTTSPIEAFDGRSRLTIEPNPDWDQLRVELPYLSPNCGGTDAQQIVMLELGDGDQPLSCDCRIKRCHACPRKLSVASRMLKLIDGDAKLGKKDRALHDRLANALESPIWKRRVDELLRVLDEGSEGLPGEVDGEPAWFAWRVDGAPSTYNLQVRPAVARAKKRGDGVITKLLSAQYQRAALEELDARDRELLRHYMLLSYYASPGAREEFLLRLADHPHLYYHDTTSRPLTLSVHDLEMLSTQHASGEVELQFTMRGERVDPIVLSRLLTMDEIVEGEQMLLSSDLGSSPSLHYLRILPRQARMLRHVGAMGMRLPAEAAGYLREQVSQRPATRSGVSFDKTMRGEEVAPNQETLIRLSFISRVLRVSVCVAPLTGGPSYAPGDGPPVVYAMREGAPVFTQRAFKQEETRAAALVEALGWEHDDDGSRWEREFLEVDAAMEAIARAREVSESREGVRLLWDSARQQLTTTSSMGNLRVGMKLKKHLFELNGGLDVEGSVVPIEQLLRAVSEQRRWVEVKPDTWVRLDDTLQRNLQKLASHREADDRVALPQMAAPTMMELAELGAIIDGPSRWLELTDRIDQARHLLPEVPDGLLAELRAYQREGFVWLTQLAHWSTGACLADDMGLGKTIQALALLLHRAAEGPSLVIAPTSVGFNWVREAARFAPDLVVSRVSSGDEAAQIKSFVQEHHGQPMLIITSYDLVARNQELFQAEAWGTLVLDEAQAIKNSATLRAQAIFEVDAKFKLALTGTPIENHAGELWSLFRVLVPGLLGSMASFRKRYQIPLERDQSPVAQAALAALVSPFILRRVKRDVARDLPERTDIRLDVELGDGERKLYSELQRALLAELSKGDAGGGGKARGGQAQAQERFQLLAAITRLRQASCHPKLCDPSSKLGSSKLQLLREQIAQLSEQGHKALVFSQFTELLKLAQVELEQLGLRVAYLDGSLTAKKRQEVVEAFQRGEYDLFLLSIKAGGVGLNLTAASFVFLLDPWWNPAVEDQATDRVHRIGQTDPVTVYRLVAEGTIEDAIYAMHHEKRALLDAVLSEASSSKALSADELRALIEQSAQPSG